MNDYMKERKEGERTGFLKQEELYELCMAL